MSFWRDTFDIDADLPQRGEQMKIKSLFLSLMVVVGLASCTAPTTETNTIDVTREIAVDVTRIIEVEREIPIEITKIVEVVKERPVDVTRIIEVTRFVDVAVTPTPIGCDLTLLPNVYARIHDAHDTEDIELMNRAIAAGREIMPDCTGDLDFDLFVSYLDQYEALVNAGEHSTGALNKMWDIKHKFEE
jgi:hypothetical protein